MKGGRVKELEPAAPGQKGGKVEIERRFLVKSIPENLEQYKNSELVSGFVIIGDHEYYRVRRSDESYSMTYKKGTGLARTEIEMPITKEMFESFWKITKPEHRSEKRRYYISYEGHTMELSVYQGALKGFVNAEIELSRENEKLVLPDWIGPEITDNNMLTNNLGKPPKMILAEAARLLRTNGLE